MNKLTSSLATLAFAAFAFTSAQADDKSPKHEGHTDHMLAGYLAVADALYKDDLDAAQEAAVFINTHDADSPLSAPAKEIIAAEDIATAREAFKTLSAKAIEMADHDGNGKYTVMNCPMVKGGQGDWLSADEKVNNPYYGARMAHCGGPKK